MCNSFGAFFQCIPASASMSRSMTQATAGGTTQLTGFISAVILITVLTSTGKVLHDLPKVQPYIPLKVWNYLSTLTNLHQNISVHFVICNCGGPQRSVVSSQRLSWNIEKIQARWTSLGWPLFWCNPDWPYMGLCDLHWSGYSHHDLSELQNWHSGIRHRRWWLPFILAIQF